MIRLPPRSTRFPYTTLFRSVDRPGTYGGDLDNRTRFLRSVVEAIRAEAPDVEIGVRLSVFDFAPLDRKSTRLNSSHANISYAVFCLKKKKSSYANMSSSRSC